MAKKTKQKRLSNSHTQLLLADWPFRHHTKVALKAREKSSKLVVLLCKTILPNQLMCNL